jgi:ATP-dependent DNA helicase RecQ
VTIADEARLVLRGAVDNKANFHPGQLEAILALVEGRRRVLVVQRTGWGKSVVYFIATRLLRDRGMGPTILISPLLALMRDQIRMASRFGVQAQSIDSTNQAEWDEIDAALAADQIDLLMISPERLANERFRANTVASIQGGIGLFVVDEAHCISDWGHDFRPDYRRIRSLTRNLAKGVPLLATTATANQRVVDDVAAQLGPGLEIIRGPLGRDSLHLQVVPLRDQAERLAWLLEYLRGVEGSGIVYALTVADADRVSHWLASHDIDAPPYHADLSDGERRDREERLRDHEVKALVASPALGMGFDKPDLGFVVHFQRPSSVIGYYQQIGRAGRALERAEVVLLTGAEDDEIAAYFIGEAFPPEEAMLAVLAATETDGGATTPEIEAALNFKGKTITNALKILEVDRAVVKEGRKWIRTVNPWDLEAERVEAVTTARQNELESMRELVTTDRCLMEFITIELDDDGAAPCGNCANCAGAFAVEEVDPALVAEANVFLKRAYKPIEPRKVWKGGIEGHRGKIPVDHRLEEGRALCSWGSAGWGDAVRSGKFSGDGFDDELVEAVTEMIETDLEPDPWPTWVTSVPSTRHEIVDDFARRLAERLGLPYRSALIKVRETPQQKQMENSPNQARNAIGSFAVRPGEIEPGPVLLVDDMVDSRWTLTTCGFALRDAGAGPVFPIALADTSTGGGP